ncbi:hypothetical protein JHK84_044929 [Glycine max]|nr:hypothetical protein JHK86_044818 [Glycine max]KAG4951568.1 hypothetical protein JHK85_045435 [Glycine max]KAG5108022.1 hypothetical protein JHK84_044929 [Glycine max]
MKGLLWKPPPEEEDSSSPLSSSALKSVVLPLSHDREVSVDENCLFTESLKAMGGENIDTDVSINMVSLLTSKLGREGEGVCFAELVSENSRMETWETSGDQIEFNSQSLGDANSNALILPAKRMRKRKGKEQDKTMKKKRRRDIHLLKEGLEGIIGVTQSCRVATKRVAYELGLHLGKEVGFQVRYDKKIGESCSILSMTDRILLQEVQDDALM